MTSTTRFTCGLLAATFVAASPLLAQRAPTQPPTNLPADVLSLACAPGLTYEEPAANTRITGGQAFAIEDACNHAGASLAEVSGQIAAVLVENGAPVEFGQALFKVSN